MTDMIDRVAKALRDRACQGLPDLPLDFYRDDARAAIEAMRNPTDAMIDAYNQADLQFVQSGWDCAIDTALNTSTKG